MKQRIVFLIIISILVIILGGLAGYLIATGQKQQPAINSYDDCVAAGYPIQESHPSRCAVPGGKTFTQESTLATFTGTIVCLPHKDTDGPHTMECATGFKADDNNYYTLHTDDSQHELSSVAGSDKKIEIKGMVVAEQSDTYKSSGTLHVTSFRFL